MRIVAVSGHVPSRVVRSADLDVSFGWSEGTAEKRSGVRVRHFVEDNETALDMAAAAYSGLKEKLGGNEQCEPPDLLLGVSGTPLQAIPFSAALFKRKLFPQAAGFPALDVGSTCLSFLWGLHVASVLPYERVLLVSSDVASCGLNWDSWESSLIFGDGAAACLVETSHGSPFFFHFLTYAEGSDYCEIRAGGSLRHPLQVENSDEDYLFAMDGKSLYKLVSRFADKFVCDLLAKASISLRDIDVVIPHQASALAMQHIKRQLRLPEEKVVDIFCDHGNQVATSLPMALYRAIEDGRLQRGQTVMMLGTSAGVSIGGVIFVY